MRLYDTIRYDMIYFIVGITYFIREICLGLDRITWLGRIVKYFTD